MDSGIQSTASGIALALAKLGISTPDDDSRSSRATPGSSISSPLGRLQSASTSNPGYAINESNGGRSTRGSISKANSSGSTCTTSSSSWVSVSPLDDNGALSNAADDQTVRGLENECSGSGNSGTNTVSLSTTLQVNTQTSQPSHVPSTKGLSAPPAQRPNHRSDSTPHLTSPQRTNGGTPVTGPVRRAQTEVIQPEGSDPRIYCISTDHLSVTVIAHCERAQSIIDMHRLSWGVQYELARGVTTGKWTWGNVIQRSNRFRGCDADNAYKVSNIMLGKPLREAVDISIWQELDREQLALEENEGRGLGLKGPWHGDPDWYGGRVQQIVQFVQEQGSSSISLQLLPLEKRRCFRFARFLGSRRVLIVRGVDESNPQIMKMMYGKFVLCGRVFIPFHTKDTSYYMVEINENWERAPQYFMGDHLRSSFAAFIQTFNDLSLNRNQPMSKWTTRWSLGLSNTVPVVEFAQENIVYIEDEYSSDWSAGKGKAPAEKIMTDGCGFMNRSALALITRRLQLGLPPAAVQGRIAGAKGLWILHPCDDSTQPKIWIRSSQNKINLRANSLAPGKHWHERVHRIFDFVAASRVGTMSHISTQSILNLSHNGVPDDVLQSLMMEGLRLEVNPFLDWNRPHADIFLWDTINKAGRVSAGRLQRLAKERGRALGLQKKSWGDEWADANRQNLEPESTSAPFQTFSGRDERTKAPISVYEKGLELLQAGFMPNRSQVLWLSIKTMMTLAIDDAINDYRIPIPKSTQAYIIPDPLGILNEGEIYYRSSQPILDEDTQSVFHVLTGEALIGRYPLRVASDIQRVIAVDTPELFNWTDLIILPVKGNVSLASYLSGGDYDGDTAFIIWDPQVVKPFKQPTLVKPPLDIISANFSRSIETVVDFSQHVYRMSKSGQMEFQKVLVNTCKDHRVGLYSLFHDIAVYIHGYGHPEVERLGHLFNLLLDSGKSGLRLLDDVFIKDKRRYDKPPPPCLESHKKKNGKETATNKLLIKRDSHLPPFVLEGLASVGEEQKDHYLSCFHEISPPAIKSQDAERDTDLLRPYEDALKMAEAAHAQGFPIILRELELIKQHVASTKEMWVRAASQEKGKGKAANSKDMFSEAIQFYVDHPPVTFIADIEKVKASYTYHYSTGAHFPFGVAFGTLCHIKACASPSGIAPSQRIFDELRFMGPSGLRVMGTVDDIPTARS